MDNTFLTALERPDGQPTSVFYAKGVEENHACQAVGSPKFREWFMKIDPDISISNITIQAVDMFGPVKVGFIKMVCVASSKALSKEGHYSTIPGSIFLRGDAVAVLPVIEITDTPETYTILTKQARLPVGSGVFEEIPAGMLDDKTENFIGAAATEMEEELQIRIQPDELFPLSRESIAPSAGGCDEKLKFYYFKLRMAKVEFESLKAKKESKTTGNAEENEKIRLRFVPLESLYDTQDAKAIIAVGLYDRLKKLEKAEGKYPKVGNPFLTSY